MAVRGNQLRTNTFRDKGAENASGRASSSRQPKERREYLPSFDLQDGRAVKIVGLFFVILSLYFLIAFTSYLFTWQDDQSYVIDANGGWGNLFTNGSVLLHFYLFWHFSLSATDYYSKLKSFRYLKH